MQKFRGGVDNFFLQGGWMLGGGGLEKFCCTGGAKPLGRAETLLDSMLLRGQKIVCSPPFQKEQHKFQKGRPEKDLG